MMFREICWIWLTVAIVHADLDPPPECPPPNSTDYPQVNALFERLGTIDFNGLIPLLNLSVPLTALNVSNVCLIQGDTLYEPTADGNQTLGLSITRMNLAITFVADFEQFGLTAAVGVYFDELAICAFLTTSGNGASLSNCSSNAMEDGVIAVVADTGSVIIDAAIVGIVRGLLASVVSGERLCTSLAELLDAMNAALPPPAGPPPSCIPSATQFPMLNEALADTVIEIPLNQSDVGGLNLSDVVSLNVSNLCLGAGTIAEIPSTKGGSELIFNVSEANLAVALGVRVESFMSLGENSLSLTMYVNDFGFDAIIYMNATGASLLSCATLISEPGVVSFSVGTSNVGELGELVLGSVAERLAHMLLDGTVLCNIFENITSALDERVKENQSSRNGSNGISQGVVLGLAAAGIGLVAAGGLSVAYTSRQKRDFDELELDCADGEEQQNLEHTSDLSEPLFGGSIKASGQTQISA